MEEERQIRIVVFHVSKSLQPDVEDRGFGFNTYDTYVQQDDGSETLEKFSQSAFPLTSPGLTWPSFALMNMQSPRPLVFRRLMTGTGTSKSARMMHCLQARTGLVILHR